MIRYALLLILLCIFAGASGEPTVVEIEPRWTWYCPSCGHDNYTPAKHPFHVPMRIQCKHYRCGAWHNTKLKVRE